MGVSFETIGLAFAAACFVSEYYLRNNGETNQQTLLGFHHGGMAATYLHSVGAIIIMYVGFRVLYFEKYPAVDETHYEKDEEEVKFGNCSLKQLGAVKDETDDDKIFYCGDGSKHDFK